MKKRVMALMLAAAMCASLGACGSNAGTEKTNEGQASSSTENMEAGKEDEVTGTVKLTLAHNMDFTTIPDGILEAANRLNEKYEKEGRDLTIEIETDYQRIDWSEYMQNIIFATQNGEGPDIFSVSGSMPDNVRSGLLYDMSDIDTSVFVDKVFDPYTVDGKIYAMPFDVPTRAIYYNKNILKAIGWTDEEIESLPSRVEAGEFTWNDFTALCKETQDKGAATWGLLHRPGSGADFLDVMKEFGGNYYNEDGQVVVNQEQVTNFFQFMYDSANTTKITPPDLNQQGWDSINTMVGDGTAFAYYGPIFSATYVATAAGLSTEEFAEQTGFMVFPKSDKNADPFTVAAPQAVSINANTEYPEICMDLLKELYSGDSTDMLAKHGNTIYSLSSVKSANELDEITSNPILAGIGSFTDYVTTVPPVEGLSTFQSELFKQIVLLELGQVTPEDAYTDLKAQVELGVDEDKVVFE